METIIKDLPIPKEVTEGQIGTAAQQALPLSEPESNGYGTDVGILIAGIIILATLYKLWLKYGKK